MLLAVKKRATKVEAAQRTLLEKALDAVWADMPIHCSPCGSAPAPGYMEQVQGYAETKQEVEAKRKAFIRKRSHEEFKRRIKTRIGPSPPFQYL